MSTIASSIDVRSATFISNSKVNSGLVAQLKDRVAAAALGGPEDSRRRHQSRGKLLARDRVARLLDPGSPFLEIAQLAAFGLYENQAPSGGVVTGVGRVKDHEVMIIANDAT